MRPLVPLPSELVDGPFTSAMAEPYGLTRRMLQGRRFRRLGSDVYVSAGQPLTHAVLARAALLAIPTGALSHASAAIAHRLPLGVREFEPRRPALTVLAGGRLPECANAVVHRADLPAAHVVPTRLGPATSVARTFVDRAAELGLEDLVALGDAALHRELTTESALADAVGWAAGRRGVRLACRALPLLNGRSASPMESWTRVVFAEAGLPRPEVNAPLFDDAGEWLAEGDLVWRAAKLVVEYNGLVHLSNRQRKADDRRRLVLAAAGWTVIPATADDVLRRPELLIDLVRSLLARAA